MEINLDGVRVVTARELANNTGRILRELNEARQTGVVTRHGRYIALIQPLAGVRVEAVSLRGLLDTDASDDEG